MKLKLIFPFLFILTILLVLTGCAKNSTNYGSFAQCLSEKGAVMYGTEWCSHCKNQKEMFGDSFQYISYVDCDWNADQCSNAGVKGYPTWIIDGKMYSGEQKLERLASLTGCQLIAG